MKKNSAPENSLSDRIKEVLKRVPRGRVATYGQIAALAGNPLAARQVVRVLHACSSKDKLPWQRIIGAKGTISLPRGEGYATQKKLLLREGVKFGAEDMINLDRFLWEPRAGKGKSRTNPKRPGDSISAGSSRGRLKDSRGR
jgi:methylated-DNA-protein-cysteine methyltransferase-like protein